MIPFLAAVLASGLFTAPAGVNPDEMFEGKVVAVAADGVMVMGKDETDVKKFVVTATTKITRNGKPAKLSEVAAGDKAQITAVMEGGKYTAKSITAVAAE